MQILDRSVKWKGLEQVPALFSPEHVDGSYALLRFFSIRSITAATSTSGTALKD